MRRALLTTTTALLLAACGGPRHVVPAGVTPAELALRDECVRLLQERWPVGTPILSTETTRDTLAPGFVAMHVNSIEKGFMSPTASYAGFCWAEQGRVLQLTSYRTAAPKATEWVCTMSYPRTYTAALMAWSGRRSPWTLSVITSTCILYKGTASKSLESRRRHRHPRNE